PKNAKNSKQQPAVVAPGTVATSPPPTAAATTAPAANPAAAPATDPVVRVAGENVTRKATTQRLLTADPASDHSSWFGTALLIGAVAVLPIVGAIALGGTGSDCRWFRRTPGP